jgi:hypothetical protein
MLYAPSAITPPAGTAPGEPSAGSKEITPFASGAPSSVTFPLTDFRFSPSPEPPPHPRTDKDAAIAADQAAARHAGTNGRMAHLLGVAAQVPSREAQ